MVTIAYSLSNISSYLLNDTRIYIFDELVLKNKNL